MSELSLRRGRITAAESASSYPPYPADWYIEDEEYVPESRDHDLEGEHVRQLFLAYVSRVKRNAAVGRNLAIRADESHARVGVDPDVYIVDDPPPDFDHAKSLKTWLTGNYPLPLAVEIVSESRPQKDYSESPRKYAVNGTHELWIFDPKMCRPAKHGPAIRLQVWRRDDEGAFDCVYAGEGPTRSEVLNAWIFVTNEGQRLSLADDAEGTQWWMTCEEQERAAKVQERAAKEQALKLVDAERVAKEQALKFVDDERVAKEQALKRVDDERVAKKQERVAKEQALKVADDERVAKEQALKVADDERVAKDYALARIAELEAMLAGRK
jgi:Uma2 family endonuclease